MKKSILDQNGIQKCVVKLAERLVAQIPWPERRQAMADVTNTLLNGKIRVAETVFGWNRNSVELGVNELRTGIVCLNDLSKRRKPKTEEKHPELLVELDNILGPESQAESHLKTDLAYTNMTASSVRTALAERGFPDGSIPSLRTLSNILNRQKYRLRRVVKNQVQKKRNTPTPSSKM